MKLRREEIHKLAEKVGRQLIDSGCVEKMGSKEALVSCIEGVLTENLKQEAALEEETRKLMEQYRSQIASGVVDSHKVYVMIKNQLAKEKKFVL